MIATVNLVIICYHTKMLFHSYWLYSPHCILIPITHLFCNWKFLPHNLPRLFLFLFFFPFIFISWRLITLQHCSVFCHTLTWISHGFTCVPHPELPSHLPPTQSLWVFPGHQPQHLSHASSLGWWSVSPLIIYLFWCCSLKTSHPRLLPQLLYLPPFWEPVVYSVSMTLFLSCLIICFVF